jgi:hypothetical protein
MPPVQLRPFISSFERAAKKLPDHIKIITCTPLSALKSFPMMDLQDALPVTA